MWKFNISTPRVTNNFVVNLRLKSRRLTVNLSADLFAFPCWCVSIVQFCTIRETKYNLVTSILFRFLQHFFFCFFFVLFANFVAEIIFFGF